MFKTCFKNSLNVGSEVGGVGLTLWRWCGVCGGHEAMVGRRKAGRRGAGDGYESGMRNLEVGDAFCQTVQWGRSQVRFEMPQGLTGCPLGSGG